MREGGSQEDGVKKSKGGVEEGRVEEENTEKGKK